MLAVADLPKIGRMWPASPDAVCVRPGQTTEVHSLENVEVGEAGGFIQARTGVVRSDA